VVSLNLAHPVVHFSLRKQALPGFNQPIERVFFSMNNMWSGMMPNCKSEPKLLTDHHKNISMHALPDWTFMNSSNPTIDC